MSVAASLSKAAQCVAGLSVVDLPVTKPYLEELAKALKDLANNIETELVVSSELAASLTAMTKAIGTNNELLLEILHRLDKLAEEAPWQ